MPSHKVMLIDALPAISPRPEQMEVLAMGFSRTGTMSLQKGLRTLGLKSYHTQDASFTKTFPYWLEALKAKYGGEGRPYGRAEFDKLLGHYNAVLDIPCIMFVDELLAAYPKAKIILTLRDIDSWLISMDRTVLEFVKWKSFSYIAPFEPVTVDPYWKLLNYVVDIWTDGNPNDRKKLVQTFRSHYDYVRAVVPKERLLELGPGSGYEPLCKFLDKPVPKDEDYPHINRPESLIERHKKLWWHILALTVKKLGTNIGAVALAAGAIWYFSFNKIPIVSKGSDQSIPA